jgi:magnesium-transporting ATPase (P-type)
MEIEKIDINPLIEEDVETQKIYPSDEIVDKASNERIWFDIVMIWGITCVLVILMVYLGILFSPTHNLSPEHWIDIVSFIVLSVIGTIEIFLLKKREVTTKTHLSIVVLWWILTTAMTIASVNHEFRENEIDVYNLINLYTLSTIFFNYFHFKLVRSLYLNKDYDIFKNE